MARIVRESHLPYYGNVGYDARGNVYVRAGWPWRRYWKRAW